MISILCTMIPLVWRRVGWWLTQQFTFLFSFAEGNAVNFCTHDRKANTDPQLTFHWNSVVEMMENQRGIIYHTILLLWQLGARERFLVTRNGSIQSKQVHGIMQRGLGRLQKLIIQNCTASCAKQNEGLIEIAVPLCEQCYHNHEEEQKPQSSLQVSIRTISFIVIMTKFAYLGFLRDLGNQICFILSMWSLLLHKKRKCPIHTGAWDYAKGTCKTTKTDHTKLQCYVCKTKRRTYCACNPTVPLCEQCCYNHEEEQKPQSLLQVTIRTISYNIVILTGFAYLGY